MGRGTYTATHLRCLARQDAWKVPATWLDDALKQLGRKTFAGCTKEEALAITEELIQRKDHR